MNDSDHVNEKKTTLLALVIAAMLVSLYLGGYGVCRETRILIHTSSVLNVEFHDQYHRIDVRDRGVMASVTGYFFWPLRDAEAKWHGRDDRLD
jgi:hypothetical protein